MEDPLPPDPYVALGVPKTADTTLIKSTYRKLALKCHPDKVADESKKAEATEKFHSIQQAYDILSDEELRERYDVQVRLADLRRQNMELRGHTGLRTDMRAAGYETRTAAPPFASFTNRGPTRVYTEDRRPSYFEDEGIPRASARKPDYSYVKRPSPKEKEQDERRERAHWSDQDKKRAERRRERETDVRQSRDRKYSYVEDEFARYEAERRQRDKEDEARRPEAPRRPPLRREEIYADDRQAADAQRYMASQSTREVPRPGMPRRNSSHEIPTAYSYSHVRRSAVERDNRSPRTSSPKESLPNTAAQKKSFENAESYERRPSTQQAAPSKAPTVPAETKDSKAQFTPQRSYTTDSTFQKQGMAGGEPTIPLPRAHTFSTLDPINTTTENSTSYKRTTEPVAPLDSGYASATTPDAQYKFYPPPPSNAQASRKTYVYPKDGGGSGNSTPKAESGNKFESYATSGYRVEVREAGTSGRRGSPPPRDRDAKPSSTAQKMAHLAAPRTHAPSGSRSTQNVYPDGATARPSMMGQSTSNRSIPRVSRSPERVSSSERERDRRYERERGRDRGRERGRERGRDFNGDYYRDDRREKLYGEMGPGYIRDTQASSNSYVDVDGVSYSRRYRDEDVVYADATSRASRERVYDDRRTPPSFSRSTTMPVGAY